jgi:chromatin segregation and condensation protein Rec8/ScpA/Scc1 (kleisin family)
LGAAIAGVHGFERALEVKKRRLLNSIPPLNLEAPKKKKDITEIIRDVYGRIKLFFINTIKDKLTFSKLLPSESKEDKVHTFIPLLYLAQQNKIDLMQENAFGEIEILLRKKEENKVEEKSNVVEGA